MIVVHPQIMPVWYYLESLFLKIIVPPRHKLSKYSIEEGSDG